MKFLIDECVATALVATAHACGHAAVHVAHAGKSGAPDHVLTQWALRDDLIIVTRNAKDFRGRNPPRPGGAYGKEDLHPGLVCINLPDAGASIQAAAFEAVLAYIATLPSMINVVVELNDNGDDWQIDRYDMPPL